MLKFELKIRRGVQETVIIQWDVLTVLLNVCVCVCVCVCVAVCVCAVCVCAVIKQIELLSFSTKPFVGVCVCVFVCVCACTCMCESMCKYLQARMGQEAALSRMDLLLKFEQF